MEFQKYPKTPRLRRNVIVTEKLDGTNAQIFIESIPLTKSALLEIETDLNCLAAQISHESNQVLTMRAGSRSRWVTPENDNFGFAGWVSSNAVDLFKLGPGRHFGEWWGQGIQRGYGLKEKRFSLFNVSRWYSKNAEVLFHDANPAEFAPKCCHIVPIMASAPLEEAVSFSLDRLRESGSYAAPGFMKPEGINVYHTAANMSFKVTLENDDKPKGK